MKNTVISFKTAVLAKDKGFDEICYSYYNDENLNVGPLARVDCNVDDYSTQLLALEAGLLQALKLIK